MPSLTTPTWGKITSRCTLGIHLRQKTETLNSSEEVSGFPEMLACNYHNPIRRGNDAFQLLKCQNMLLSEPTNLKSIEIATILMNNNGYLYVCFRLNPYSSWRMDFSRHCFLMYFFTERQYFFGSMVSVLKAWNDVNKGLFAYFAELRRPNSVFDKNVWSCQSKN